MSRCKKFGCDEERLTRFGITFQYCADHTSPSSIDRAAAFVEPEART